VKAVRRHGGTTPELREAVYNYFKFNFVNADEAKTRFYFEKPCWERSKDEPPLRRAVSSRGSRRAAWIANGIVDRLMLGKEHMILIDYKTHRRAAAGNVQALAEEFTGQMRQYAAGASRLWPNKKLRVVLLFSPRAAKSWKFPGRRRLVWIIDSELESIAAYNLFC
jgi:ATP-dependent exoDNAse (exonuclease V) beta subunit